MGKAEYMIYVDDLQSYPHKREKWCHMATDGDRDELHAFAQKIGLKRHWFQGGRLPHYDITTKMRAVAIYHGAIEVNSIALYRKCFNDLPS